MSIQYLSLPDYLLIAEWVLGQSAEVIVRLCRLDLAESALHAPAASFGGVDFYPKRAAKAAVLCVHLVKNHPLVDGNKRVAFVCMVEFLARNGLTWAAPPGDEDGQLSAAVILDTAAGPGDAAAVGRLADWIEERIAPER